MAIEIGACFKTPTLRPSPEHREHHFLGYCLALPWGGRGEHQAATWMKRFDARFWTVDFPRPMMGCVVSTGVDALRVELAFTGRDNLAGLIWEAVDRWDHPLCA